MALRKTTLKRLAHEAAVKKEVDALFADNDKNMGSNAGEAINTILCEYLTAKECRAIVLKVAIRNQGAKVNFRIGAENGIVFDETAKYKADLTTHGYLFGATREDAGLRDPSNGAKFIGIAVNRKKYPYVFQKLDGKLTLYPQMMFNAVKGLNSR